MLRLMKNNLVITGVVAVVFFSTAVYTTYAAVVVPSQTASGTISTQNKQAIEKIFATRIAQFRAFASSTPVALDAVDKKLLTTQIDTAIANINVVIDLLDGKNRPALVLSTYPGYYLNASDTPSLVKMVSLDTTLLALKISLLTRVFRPDTNTNHVEAQKLLLTKNITSAFSIPGFVSASSTVSADVLHQIVIAASMKEIQHLQNRIQLAESKNNILKIKNIVSKKIIASSTLDVEPVVATSTPEVQSVAPSPAATTTDETTADDASSTPQ